MGSARILIVDDEESIRFFLTNTLKQEYQVVTAESGEAALVCLQESAFDLVMLDLRLRGRMDGMRALETIKLLWPETAVIIITAHGSFESALAALREGVDGYLLKPIGVNEIRQVVGEVLARRERLLKNSSVAQEDGYLQAGDLLVDLKKHMVTCEGQPIELTPGEFKLLVYLIKNRHRTISPQELVAVVQGYECEEKQEAREIIKWYIHRLRHKIERDASHPRYILNVRGVGYTFSE